MAVERIGTNAVPYHEQWRDRVALGLACFALVTGGYVLGAYSHAGPPGPPGIQGPQGVAGPQGPAGRDGTNAAPAQVCANWVTTNFGTYCQRWQP